MGGRVSLWFIENVGRPTEQTDSTSPPTLQWFWQRQARECERVCVFFLWGRAGACRRPRECDTFRHYSYQHYSPLYNFDSILPSLATATTARKAILEHENSNIQPRGPKVDVGVKMKRDENLPIEITET